MSIKLGINGLGRIGKLVLRLTLAQNNIEVVHINDMMNTELMAHLLKYDSIHGKLNASVTFDDNHIIINDKPIRANSNHFGRTTLTSFNVLNISIFLLFSLIEIISPALT